MAATRAGVSLPLCCPSSSRIKAVALPRVRGVCGCKNWVLVSWRWRMDQVRRRGTASGTIAEMVEAASAQWAADDVAAAPAPAPAPAPAITADHPTSASLYHDKPQQEHSSAFQRVSTQQELLDAIDLEVAAGRLPAHAGDGMKDFYANYRDAVQHSELEDARKSVVPIMATVLDRILLQFEDPFTFPPCHQSLREPFDYYRFGQEYIRPLIQFSKSYIGNKGLWDIIDSQVQQGHNVVLFSNHQTEADPAVIALLLESSHPYLAEKMTYIAGDRVILDPFCKPFSMGRNLICVHSKKHINDEPELVEMKRRANTRALKELAVLLRTGSQLIWIAPSGGRDRPDPVTNIWNPAEFDPAAVDNMRRLVERGDLPGHMYPMALLSYNIMPPPPKVQKEIGERRLVGCHGVGISVGSEVNSQQDNAHERVWESVREQYAVLYNAVHEGQGESASTASCKLCQPWLAR